MKSFASAGEMNDAIIAEAMLQIDAQTWTELRKNRIKRALKRPRVRRAFLDKALVEADSEDAMILVETAPDVFEFQLDWAKIIDVIIKLLPLLLMFL